MGLYVYVDNSNIWIEGKYVSAVEKGFAPDVYTAHSGSICDYGWNYDFGKLLSCVSDGRSDIVRAVLYGSKPTENDSLWAAPKRYGFEVFTPRRNVANKEKKVDMGLGTQIILDLCDRPISPDDKIVMVVGDADYIPVVEAINGKHIPLRIAFWDHASTELRQIAPEFFSLNPHLTTIQR